jgi:sulfur carrier protein
MIIRVNDQPHEVAEGAVLAALIGALGLSERKGLAIAVNDEVAPRTTWAMRKLMPTDHVLVIQATQGG